MKLSNKDLTQKIVKLFEEKSTVSGNVYNDVENFFKNNSIVRRHVDAFDIYKKYIRE